MEKFLGFIITAILIFYALKLVVRLLMPFILKRFVKKMNDRFGGEQQYHTHNDIRQEGDVTVEYHSPKKQPAKKRLTDELNGEYVDFEEVE